MKGRTGVTAETYRDDWATPQQFVDELARMIGIDCFDLDVCATKSTAKAAKYLGPDHEDSDCRDAVRGSWLPARWCWCNPPFDHRIVMQFAIAAVAHARFGATTAMILPVTKVETEPFHFLMDLKAIEAMIWTRGRLQYDNKKGVGFGSVVLIIGSNKFGRSPTQGVIRKVVSGGKTIWQGQWR